MATAWLLFCWTLHGTCKVVLIFVSYLKKEHKRIDKWALSLLWHPLVIVIHKFEKDLRCSELSHQFPDSFGFQLAFFGNIYINIHTHTHTLVSWPGLISYQNHPVLFIPWKTVWDILLYSLYYPAPSFHHRHTKPRSPISATSDITVRPSGQTLHSLLCLIFVLQLCSFQQNNTHKTE